jgi:hypothetical protein
MNDNPTNSVNKLEEDDDDMAAATQLVDDNGWTTDKFVVKHYRRGDLLDGEAFVLVPARDPAALVALRAYAEATPDGELETRLKAWADHCDGGESTKPTIDDKLPTRVASYASAVESGQMELTTALFRIARDVVRGDDELPTLR